MTKAFKDLLEEYKKLIKEKNDYEDELSSLSGNVSKLVKDLILAKIDEIDKKIKSFESTKYVTEKDYQESKKPTGWEDADMNNRSNW